MHASVDPGTSSVPSQGGSLKRVLIPVAWFLVLTSLFALAYNQAPLFTSNQNQYFLHGYAQAGFGNLSQDWLANTVDPTPVFSFLVALTLRLFNSGIPFYFYYALLMGVYFFSLFGIVDRLFPFRTRKLTSGLFIAAVLLLHSAALRYLLQQFFGGDWPYLFEGGVAGQRLLGTVFQPSTFGVLLLLSVYLYLSDRKVFAVLASVLAATVHPTYLLSVAALTLAFLFDTWRSTRKIWPVLQLGFLALVVVSPIFSSTYSPSSLKTPLSEFRTLVPTPAAMRVCRKVPSA